MTSTERVIAAIEFRTPDRLPRWDNYHIFGTFPQRWRAAKGLPEDALPEDYYGIDIAMVACEEGPFASQQGAVGRDGDYELFRDGWGRTVRQKPGEAFFMNTVQTVLEDKANLDRLEFDDPKADWRFRDYVARVERERAAGRLAFTKVGGLYCRSQFMRREDRLLMDMVTDEAFCHALFERVGDHLLQIGLEQLRRTNSWETGIWVYDDFANSRAPMFSPAMWEKYLLPVYSRMIETWRAAGCRRFFLHSDGNIVPNMDNLLAAGFQGFNPLEPRCGIDLLRLRERYGTRVVFFGGMCNTRVLPRGDRAEIEAFVRPLIELGRSGGLVIGMASIGDDISVEAYDYYIGILDKYANYGAGQEHVGGRAA
jgi:hypothetical protein